MRAHVYLIILLMIAPTAQSGPGDLVFIELHGAGEDHVMLEWDVVGGELTSLTLVRAFEGDVEFYPLDPEARTYADIEVSVEANAVYILYATFDGGVTLSNPYVAVCLPVEPDDDFPFVEPHPECLP